MPHKDYWFVAFTDEQYEEFALVMGEASKRLDSIGEPNLAARVEEQKMRIYDAIENGRSNHAQYQRSRERSS